jgi:hypothetical protein
MREFIVLQLLGLIFTSVSIAQVSEDALRAKYEQEAIYTFNNNKYVKGGETKRTGFLGRKLTSEFTHTSEGMQEFQQYRKKAKTGFWLTTGAVAGLFGSAVLISVNPALGIAAYSAVIATSITGGVFAIKSQEHFERAVWLRNRDELIRAVQ